jgi:hypothetical protein
VRDLLVQVVVVRRPDEKALVRLWQEKRGQVGPEDRERPDRAPEILMPAQGDRLCCGGSALSPLELTYRFLRLGNLDGGAFERLGRYSAALWKQTAQTLLLGSVRRRWRVSRRYQPRSVSGATDVQWSRGGGGVGTVSSASVALSRWNSATRISNSSSDRSSRSPWGRSGATALEFGIFGEKPPHRLHHFRSRLDHPQLQSGRPAAITGRRRLSA